jgi:hypothetical protein
VGLLLSVLLGFSIFDAFLSLYLDSSYLYSSHLFLLAPNFLTGFCDGESSFTISIWKDSKSKTGYSVKAIF